MPLLYHTDDCCHEHDLLATVFGTLRDHRMNVGVEEQLQALTLSEPVRYLRSEAETRTAISMLQEEVNDGKLSVVGLDIEWPPFEKDAKASTLQLAVADGRVYVIALYEFTAQVSRSRPAGGIRAVCAHPQSSVPCLPYVHIVCHVCYPGGASCTVAGSSWPLMSGCLLRKV